jgi:asparagine synthase (glutamine-hydrolysing)
MHGEAWTKKSVTQMVHRGPDSQKTVGIASGLWMGVARLAMTDPHPRADQPFVDPSTGNAISFNGEIYNYREIRNELEILGEVFHTDSDTEVLLKFLGNFGVKEIWKLNGMFSFAFYSSSEDSIFLVRDALGKKPLYLKQIGRNFYWSSSQRSLRNLDNRFEISDIALIQYLSLGYLLDPTSLYEEIYAIRPGESIRINYKDRTCEVMDLQFSTKEKNNENSPLRGRIHQSVVDRVSGHNKIGLSLSGGMDSSIVAIELSKLGLETTAYSAEWKDSDKKRYNHDAEAAKLISRSLGLRFRSVEMLESNHVETELRRFLLAMEEPNNNPSGVSMMKLYAAMAEDGQRLVLTGDGSDEIFGGYQRYISAQILPNLFKIRGNRVFSPAFADTLRESRMPALINSQLSNSSSASWLYWHWTHSPRELQRVLNSHPSSNETYGLISESLQKLVELPESMPGVQSLMMRDHKIWLPMESNRKLDRVSMAYSIEARSPFQDDRVINWAHQDMVKSGFKQMGKVALCDAYPEMRQIGTRNDKAGFTSPVGHWLRTNPDLVRRSIQILSRDKRFSRSELVRMQDAPIRGNYRELMQLWSLVVLATWFDLGP